MREVVFFNVEATAPSAGRRCRLLEFGAVLVCPKKLVEVGSYSTLISPGGPCAVPKRFAGTGVDVEAIGSAPALEDVADNIFEILDGRIWAGHNIRRFDSPRIRQAFADVGRPAPEPVGVIDSLSVLSQGFGRRAGDLKMATLASYFGLGKQKHNRSLDDARMNLEVLKHCATVLLLESTLPDVLRSNSIRDVGAVTRTMSRPHVHDKSIAEAATKKLPNPNPATQKIGPYKRDNLGNKVVGRATEALRGRQAATPFHMILRHSRAIHLKVLFNLFPSI